MSALNLVDAVKMKQKLNHSSVSSDIHYNSWKLESIRQQLANVMSYCPENLSGSKKAPMHFEEIKIQPS